MSYQATGQALAALGILKDEFNRWSYVERFLRNPHPNADLAAGTPNAAEIAASFASNPDWEIAGANAAATTGLTSGGVLITTATNGNDQGFLIPHQDSVQSNLNLVQFDTDYKPAFHTRVRTGSAITTQLILAGLTSDKTVDATYVLGDNDDECYFYYNPASSLNWQIAIARSGSDQLIDLGSDFAVEAATDYTLGFHLDDDRVPHFYINGQWVCSPAALDASTALYPRVGIEDLSAGTAYTLGVRKIALARDFT